MFNPDDFIDKSDKLMADSGNGREVQQQCGMIEETAHLSARLNGLDSNINKIKVRYSADEARKFILRVFELENEKGQGYELLVKKNFVFFFLIFIFLLVFFTLLFHRLIWELKKSYKYLKIIHCVKIYLIYEMNWDRQHCM